MIRRPLCASGFCLKAEIPPTLPQKSRVLVTVRIKNSRRRLAHGYFLLSPLWINNAGGCCWLVYDHLRSEFAEQRQRLPAPTDRERAARDCSGSDRPATAVGAGDATRSAATE